MPTVKKPRVNRIPEAPPATPQETTPEPGVQSATNTPEAKPQSATMEEDVRQMNVFQRMRAVVANTAAIKKGGKNEIQHYSFIEQAAIVAEIKYLLPAFGLFLKTEVTDLVITEEKTKNGTPQDACLMKCRYTIINVDAPKDPEERILWEEWPSLARDTSDKCINKASTANLKFWMIRQFLISDHDPDSDSPETGAKRGDEPGAPNPRRISTRQSTLQSRPEHREGDHMPEGDGRQETRSQRAPELPLDNQGAGTQSGDTGAAPRTPVHILSPINTKDWRNYVIDCGKDIRGKKVSMLALPSLKEISAFLRNRMLERVLTPEEDRTLQMTEAGIAELEEAFAPPGSKAPSAVEVLAAKLDNIVCTQENFVHVMKKYKLLGAEVVRFSDVSEDLARDFVNDWKIVTDTLDREDGIPGLKQ